MTSWPNVFQTTPEVRISKMELSTVGKSEQKKKTNKKKTNKKKKTGDKNKMMFQWSTHTVEPSAAQPPCILNETEDEKNGAQGSRRHRAFYFTAL